jgi:class 3 adenylate cyclase
LNAVVPELPGGTVTFVFTDIEGSTQLLQRLGDRYADVTRDHRRIVRDCFGAAGGTEIDTQGDAFFFSFARARDAVRGAVDAQRALGRHAWPHDAAVRVRMGLHTGEPTVGEEGYIGLDVVRAARICSAGHGGQILVSETTRALLGNQLPEGVSVRDLGRAKLKDIQHERIYQLSLDGGQDRFPPLKAERRHVTAEEDLAERIQRHVEQRIERSLAGVPFGPDDDGTPLPAGLLPAGTGRAAATGLGILALTVLTLVGIVVVAILLVRLAL